MMEFGVGWNKLHDCIYPIFCNKKGLIFGGICGTRIAVSHHICRRSKSDVIADYRRAVLLWQAARNRLTKRRIGLYADAIYAISQRRFQCAAAAGEWVQNRAAIVRYHAHQIHQQRHGFFSMMDFINFDGVVFKHALWHANRRAGVGRRANARLDNHFIAAAVAVFFADARYFYPKSKCSAASSRRAAQRPIKSATFANQ